MKRYSIGWLALCLMMIMGCQKEVSFEVGNTPSDGSLLSEITGDCLTKNSKRYLCSCRAPGTRHQYDYCFRECKTNRCLHGVY